MRGCSVILYMNQIEIYQTKDKQTEIEVNVEADTVWLTQDQMTRLFARERTVITKQINNVFKKEELDKKAMCKKCTFQNQTNRLQCTALMLLSRWVIGSNPNGVPNFVNGPHSGFCRYRCSGWRSPEGNNSNGKNKI